MFVFFKGFYRDILGSYGRLISAFFFLFFFSFNLSLIASENLAMQWLKEKPNKLTSEEPVKPASVVEVKKAQRAPLSGFFLEGYGGLILGLDKFLDFTTKNTYDITGLKCSFEKAEKLVSPTFNVGLKLGSWFEKTEYHQHKTPGFLKYFGCYLDLNYHYLKYDHTLPSVDLCYLNQAVNPNLGPAFARTKLHLITKGPTLTTSFLLAARLGFLKTESVPFGWFQPYLAVGPGAIWIKQRSKVIISPHATSDDSELYVAVLAERTMKGGSSDQKLFPCLTADLGFDFRFARHFSLDYFFRYNYLVTHFSYSAYDWYQKERYHLFSNQLGLGFHF